ncbi:UNVERIFIED_CONTAM: hypothetical protein H355_013743 [Colinus virginianus]|nr:hypothetical protein H355_013743 [Colinus virginianus]
MRGGDAGQHPRRRQVERGRLLPLLSCAILACCAEVAALRDFSAEYKTKSACENQELKLHCQESKFLIIYSAIYGRAHEDSICSSKAEHIPQFVPKFILTAVNHLVTHNNSSTKQNDSEHGVDIDPKESRSPKKDGTIVSNSLATFAYIRDFQKLQGKKEHLVPESDGVDESSESEEEEDEDSSASELPDELAELYRPSYSGYNSAEAADLAERIERREQIMQEIWMNSGLDMTPPRNMNTFYINEE